MLSTTSLAFPEPLPSRPLPLNKNKDRIPLVLTYYPTNLHIQRIILRHFRHVRSNLTTKDIFPSLLLSAFRRDRSLRDSLVRSTLPTNPTTPGTFPCNRRKCYICPYTSPSPLTKAPNKRRLGDRFVEHLRSVRDKQQHLLVTNYFISPSHSLGFLQRHNDATCKLEEQHLIFRLRSLQPNGL
eukprot:g18441.t1